MIGGAVGGAVAVVAAPAVLAGAGFTGAGIAVSSVASSMMSSAAIANGGGVAAGGIVALCQSAGATGVISYATTAAVGTIGLGVGAIVGRKVMEN